MLAALVRARRSVEWARIPVVNRSVCDFCTETRDLTYVVKCGQAKWIAGSVCIDGVKAFIVWCKGLHDAFAAANNKELELAFKLLEHGKQRMIDAHVAKGKGK